MWGHRLALEVLGCGVTDLPWLFPWLLPRLSTLLNDFRVHLATSRISISNTHAFKLQAYNRFFIMCLHTVARLPLILINLFLPSSYCEILSYIAQIALRVPL